MTLQRRLTLAVALSVAVVIALGSVLVLFVVRSTLQGQVDDVLRERTVAVRSRTEEIDFTVPVPEGIDVPPPPERGGAFGYVQVLDPAGRVVAISSESGASAALAVSDQARAVAAGTEVEALQNATIDGIPYRVLTTRLSSSYTLQVALPVDTVDAALRQLTVILLLVAVAGAGLAVVLGAGVARTAIGPVRELTETVEHVTATTDLSARIDVAGEDELARLASSFNHMLAALDESLASQRRLVADASHELRTPLTSVRTNIEILERQPDLPLEERRRVLHDVVGQLEELSVLVADLVDLARNSETEPELTDVRLDEVVATAVDRARGHRPEVRFEAHLEPTLVRGAPDRLLRAIGNLLDNAAKYSDLGGAVEIDVRDGTIEVRDHGPGVDPADLPHVFDRFFRASDTRGRPGTGLGLSIVKQVADSHGGTATAANADDGGAVFRLSFPHTDAQIGSLDPVR